MSVIDGKDRIKILGKFNGRCAYCGDEISKGKFHVDHIKPYRRYLKSHERINYNGILGENKMENYNPSCASCNSSKSTFSIEQWREEIKLKAERLLRDESRFRLLVRFGIVEIKNIDDFKFYFEK